MEQTSVDVVRSFNRTVTQRVGALQSSYLGHQRPLGVSRLLWEIGADGRDLRELRETLDLDSGYLSRMLRSLERSGLVTTRTSDGDGRVRTAKLTAAGRRERAELDHESDTLAWSLLEPLNGVQRAQLLDAMATVE